MPKVTIHAGFWREQQAVNADQAIFHQWEQLEASGCIQNFRIAAGESAGCREGWFFADSDAYKWLDAAARIWAARPEPRLAALMDGFIALLGRAQQPDGYLYTYNQVHFPGQRWENLQIEHELYCHGHLIEAGVSHWEATGRVDLLEIARRAASRVIEDFMGKGPQWTPGHQEIEIALLRLHAATPGDTACLEMARQFLERRGRTPRFALHILREFLRVGRRHKQVQQQKQACLEQHPGAHPYQLPPANFSKRRPFSTLRWYASALRGQYAQQHAPIRRQTVPVGHAVRFAYMETAAAMLARETSDAEMTQVLASAWEHMVTRRMYLTGGIGSQPGLEGFGRDHDLHPEYAYAETCAALGSMFWSRQMALLTGAAMYSDLFEWQLYNAAAVGMGLDGRSYLYNNPLLCRGGVERRPWFAVPCCPSNLSRTWASLGDALYTALPGRLRIEQYISSQAQIDLPGEHGPVGSIRLEQESELPWKGRARLRILALETPGLTGTFEICLRLPAWAGEAAVSVNGEAVLHQAAQPDAPGDPVSGGYDPRPAAYLPVHREWQAGDSLEITLAMPPALRRTHPQVKGHRGRVALTRGPLVYCLESVDNRGTDLFEAQLDPASLQPQWDGALLGGIVKIEAQTRQGAPLVFIPYFLWGNRGPTLMNVWAKE